MNYQLTRSNRKTLSIIIRDGKVLVKAPYFVSDQSIEKFVLSKHDWIESKLSEYEAVGIDIETQDYVRLWGHLYRVELSVGKRFSVHEDTVARVLYIVAPTSHSFDLINRKIEAIMKDRLTNILDKSVVDYAGLLKLKTPPFKVRRYKRLHGRCSSNGELAFNTYLYHESLDFINYVVLHECAHLIEFNHSAAFYKIIEAHMPNYKAIIASSKSKDNLHQDL